MKFRFPVVIIDEDFRSENSSGLGIRVLAKAIEEEGIEKGSCLSYAQNKNATPNAFRCVSEGIKRQKYVAERSGGILESCQVAFTEEERLDATTN